MRRRTEVPDAEDRTGADETLAPQPGGELEPRPEGDAASPPVAASVWLQPGGDFRGRTIGLLAGNGNFPMMFAREARARGCRVAAVAHRGETDAALEEEVDSIVWVRVGQLGKVIRSFHRAGVDCAVMAGGINKVRSLTSLRPDLRGLLFVSRVAGLGDDAILRALAAELEGDNIHVVPSTLFLERLLARAGRMAGPSPSRQTLDDIKLGCRVLSALGALDVGQTVVVERGVVLAIEAIEGTDETLRRAARLGRGGSVLVKAAKQSQDLRFDLPAVGPATIETMATARADVLAIEAGRTLVLDADRSFELADRYGISIVGCNAGGAVAGLSDD